MSAPLATPISVAGSAAADRTTKRKPASPFMKNIVAAILIFGALIGAWEMFARTSGVSSVLLPAPSEIGKYLWKVILNGELWSASLVTMRRLLVGYAIGLAAGIPLGLLTARFKLAHYTIGVVALGLQTLPSVCWAPLALLWFGIDENAMLFIVVMGTLWAVIIATDHGIRQIPPIYREAASTMGSRGLHLWVHVLLPAALPHIVSGTKQGWAFAWRSLMAAEIYVQLIGATGLGLVLHYGREVHAMEQVVGIMLVIVFIGFAADKALFSPWENFLRRRWGLAKN